ncbi:hypothetical protein BDR04DRAFT_1164915 [Suillus decipiens]|nr:hypothetical protein BDR04DRAFT_1164915 [Suillus decipiens]
MLRPRHRATRRISRRRLLHHVGVSSAGTSSLEAEVRQEVAVYIRVFFLFASSSCSLHSFSALRSVRCSFRTICTRPSSASTPRYRGPAIPQASLGHYDSTVFVSIP